MKLSEKYKFSFDVRALIFFALIIIPNIVWAFIPAKNDFLRIQSVTPIVDIISTVFQIIFIAMLCFIVPKEFYRNQTLMILTCTMIGLYLGAWIIYYVGFGSVIPLVLIMTLAPCAVFIFYELAIKNYLALIPTIVFTICHIIFAFKNFIIK